MDNMISCRVVMWALIVLNLGDVCFGEQDVYKLSMGRFIKHYGYPYENHTVRTEDGFYLTIGRIPYRNTSGCRTNKGVVILWHGLFGNGYNFLFGGPYQALGFLLSQECYDVWLPNTRGTLYSLKHDYYSINDRAFWNFTIDELTSRDYPPVIHYIWNKTGRTKIHGLGVSMGATKLVQLFARFPKYQELFSSMHLMAPALYLGHVNLEEAFGNLPKHLLLEASEHLTEMLAFPGGGKRMQAQKFLHELCKLKSRLCGILSDYNRKTPQEREVVWLNMSKIAPDRSSAKVVCHFFQMHLSGKPAMYNYGPEANLVKYGSEEPPPYPIEEVMVPAYIYHSRGDAFVNNEDIFILAKHLPNVKGRHCVEKPNFSHYDFGYSPHDMKELVNQFVIRALKNIQT